MLVACYSTWDRGCSCQVISQYFPCSVVAVLGDSTSILFFMLMIQAGLVAVWQLAPVDVIYFFSSSYILQRSNNDPQNDFSIFWRLNYDISNYTWSGLFTFLLCPLQLWVFPPKLPYDKYLRVKTSMALKLGIMFYFGP